MSQVFVARIAPRDIRVAFLSICAMLIGEVTTMEMTTILSAIDEEISKLMKARELLSGIDSDVPPKTRRGRPVGSTAASKTAKKSHSSLSPSSNIQYRGKISAAGRARIAAAMKARWAKRREAMNASAAKPASAGTKATIKKAASKKAASK